MEDDFDFSAATNSLNDPGDLDLPDAEDDATSPTLKVGDEKEIGKNGLKKKLLKEGEGWDTPGSGDEVEGIIIDILYLYTHAYIHTHVCVLFDGERWY